MDIHSVEFYVLALFVAFALVGLIFGRSDRSPARTYIESMDVSDDIADAPHEVTLVSQPDGLVTISHRGLELKPGDTVNLVATIIDDKIKLVLKRGVNSPTGEPVPVKATVSVKYLPNERIHVRYESEFTGEWTVFTYTNREGQQRTSELQR